MIKYVFFDFFGTLVDYDPSIHPDYNAPLAFARRAGSEISEIASNAYWQMAWDDLDAVAVRSGREFSMYQVSQRYWRSIGSPPLVAGAIDTLIAEYLDAWTVNVSPAPHALECVADLSSDHALAIVSNTHHPDLVPRLVRQFGLHTSIDRVVASVNVGWRKPHPIIFEAALREVGAAAEEVVFVGDSWDADIEGPRQAGMAAVYVGRATEHRPSATLKELPGIVRSLT